MAKRKGIIPAVAIGLAAGVGYVLYRSNHILTTTKYSLKSAKLPPAFDGLKIALLSDLHGKSYGYNNETLLEHIEKLTPDIVVMAGDMIRNREDFTDFVSLCAALAKRYKTYFVLGNHEVLLGTISVENLCEMLADAGVTVLNNEKAVFECGGESIDIYGLWINLRFYRDSSGLYHKKDLFSQKDMAEILGTPDESRFKLLITHNPNYFETYAMWGADLSFCGHLHGGIIRIPHLGGLLSPEIKFFPEYDKGLFSMGNSFMLVSGGLGNGHPPARFLNSPEVCLITLKSGAVQNTDSTILPDTSGE